MEPLLAGRYRPLRELGRGGSSRTLLVEDLTLGRDVVLKQLRLDRAELESVLRREVSLLAEVEHPNIVPVYDYVPLAREDGGPGFTTSYVEGRSFSEAVRGRAYSAVLPSIAELLSALEALNGIGLAHGDIKSDNVLVDKAGRTTLLDFGCVRELGRAPDWLSGTLSQLDPALLEGRCFDVRTEIFALGRLLEESLAGVVGVPTEVGALASRMTSSDLSQRPAQFSELLDCLGIEPKRQQVSGRRPWLGQAELSGEFERFVASLGARQSAGVRLLHSAPGDGRSRALDVLRLRAELNGVFAEALPIQGRLSDLLARHVGYAVAGAEQLAAAVEKLAESSESRLWLFDDLELFEDSERQAITWMMRVVEQRRTAGLPSALGLVASSSFVPLGWHEAARWHLARLDLAAQASWVGALVPTSHRQDLARITEGSPALLTALCARLSAGHWSLGHLRRQEAQSELLVVSRPITRVADDPSALEKGRRQAETMLSEQTAEAEQPSPSFGLRARGRAELVGNWIAQELAAGRWQDALRFWLEGSSLGEWLSVRWAELAAKLLQFPLAAQERLRCAEALLEGGRPRDAISALASALRERPEPAVRVVLHRIAADVRLAEGRLREAEGELRRAGRCGAAESDEALGCLLVEARLRLRQGEAKAAAELCEQGLAEQAPPGLAQRFRELQGLAMGYQGQFEFAGKALEIAVSEAEQVGSVRAQVRSLGYLGILEGRRGDHQRAATLHQRALSLADREGLDELLSSTTLNLGTALEPLGRLAEALTAYERAARVATALGRESTRLTATFNRANLFARLGQRERASALLEGLEAQLAENLANPLRFAVGCLALELALDGQQHEQQQAGLAQLQQLEMQRERAAGSADPGRWELALLAQRVELEARRHGPSELASGSLGVLEQRLIRLVETAPSGEARMRAALLAVRFIQERGDCQRALDCLEKWSEPELRDHPEFLAAKATLAFQLHRALGAPALARLQAERARLGWQRLADGLSPAMRDSFYAKVGYSLLEEPVPEALGGSEIQRDFARLLEINKRLNSTLSRAEVLQATIDAAIELTRAERGFVLLVAEGGFEVACARHFSRETLTDPQRELSRSIAERVIREQRSVLTLDAATDGRFASHESVHLMQLKSVLCLPIVAPAGVLGALYLDSRLSRGRFDARAEGLLSAFSDQVAIALENARLHEALALRTCELELEKRRVEELSEERRQRIDALEEALAERSSELVHRYDYRKIVARSRAMHEVFLLLDRVTDVLVDVMITGESGTGKELVAKALHFNGPRKSARFVGINCAALPEALLESELFGHVRGAFTGAERDNQGLFLAATGGTLFLDEIGEMPLAVQSKLLRVLEERVVRPLGSSEARPVDLRIVTATHRDLRAEVAAGRFREDLFFRLAVVEIRLPPLRERRDDIAPIAESILSELAQERGVSGYELSPSAMRRLTEQPFPGNVRELRNLLVRATVLSEKTLLTERDLAVQRSPRQTKLPRSRGDWEEQEQTRLRDTLAECRWNVSEVSRRLGIPRNTLYRKLARYGLLEPTEPPKPR